MDSKYVTRMENIIEANRRYRERLKNNFTVDFLDPEKKRDTIIHGMRGLGDNIFQRAYIKNLGVNVWLDTPWPELYEDLEHVKFIKCATPLRTQLKNIGRQTESRWSLVPVTDTWNITIFYGASHLAVGSIQKRMFQQFGVEPGVFDIPKFKMPEHIDSGGKPIAVIRPVTVRKEWMNSARNPEPEYISRAAYMLRCRGFYVISVCDLEDDKEWLVGKVPLAHRYFHKGELSMVELLGLVQNSAALVGGVGWLLPASLATKVPMLVIAGGHGEHNAPEKVSDVRFVDADSLTWIFPENYCRCADMHHECKKKINNFEEKAQRWITTLLR